MTEKIFLSADQLLQDSYELAAAIYADSYYPDFVVGVWRGGTPVAIAIHELLDFCGVKADHCAVRARSYCGIDQREQGVKIDGLEYLAQAVGPGDKILLVDDVHDTGHSFKALLEQLHDCFANRPNVDIRMASLYYKPGKSEVDFEPHYYLHACDDWLVFPHELGGLTEHELRVHKPGIERVKQLLLDKTQ